MDIHLVQKVMNHNDEAAVRLRERLRRANVTAIHLLGGPGSGKTTLIEQALHHAGHRCRFGVVVTDPETSRDAQRVSVFDVPVVQITTAGACHLEPHLLERALDHLPLEDLDIVLIENVGSMGCPVGVTLGESKRVAVLSVAEGHDKAAKYPKLFQTSDIVVLTKLDLMPYTHFNEAEFDKDLRAAHEGCPVIRVSCATTQGIAIWCDWIESLVKSRERVTIG